MSVNELIAKLQSVEDKSLNCLVAFDDDQGPTLYLDLDVVDVAEDGLRLLHGSA